MVGWIIIGVLVVVSLGGLLYGESHKPRGRDRGGFEEHPGPGPDRTVGRRRSALSRSDVDAVVGQSTLRINVEIAR